MIARHQLCVVAVTMVLAISFSASSALAYCSSCNSGVAPAYSVGYAAPATYTTAYAPTYTTAYAPTYTTAYAPAYTTTNSGWYPGYWLGRANRSIWGVPQTTYYAPTYGCLRDDGLLRADDVVLCGLRGAGLQHLHGELRTGLQFVQHLQHVHGELCSGLQRLLDLWHDRREWRLELPELHGGYGQPGSVHRIDAFLDVCSADIRFDFHGTDAVTRSGRIGSARAIDGRPKAGGSGAGSCGRHRGQRRERELPGPDAARSE